MANWRDVSLATLISGTLAGLTSTVALMLVSRAEGHGALQPTNATSHWLHGEGASSIQSADLTHTGVGFATNHAATLFWAFPFQTWLAFGYRRRPSSATVVRDAIAMSAIAAAVDYSITPKRFTPGWELVLSKRGMALTYGAMAAGLVAGALLVRRTDHP